MSKVVLTLEFPNVEAAAAALNAVSRSTQQVVVVVPPALPVDRVVAVSDAQSTTTPAVVLTEKPARKPRSDAGQLRGPHKDATETKGAETGAPVGAQALGAAGQSTPAQAPVAVSTPAATPSAAANPNAKLTQTDARDALGRINKTAGMGMPAIMEHLKQFGVNRVSILPEADYALFIKQADEKIAEHLAAAKK